MTTTDCLFCKKVASPDLTHGPDFVWEFPHSVAFLGPWQFYHGYCVLVSRLHATELSQLGTDDRRAHLDEMCLLARAIEDCFRPKKLNYELIGNQVPHIHWHLFPRYERDPDFKHTVWVALERARDDRSRRRQLEQGPVSRSDTILLLRQQLTNLISRAA